MILHGRSFACLASIVITLAAPSCAEAKEAPSSLVQTSPWQPESDATACHVTAKFGSGDDLVSLRLSKDSFKIALDLAATGPKLGYTNGWLWFDYAFNTSRNTIRAAAQTALLDGEGGFVGTINPNPLAQTVVDGRISDSMRKKLQSAWQDFDPDRANELILIPPDKSSLRLHVGPMGKPLRMLNECVDRLASSWGFDVAVMRSLERWPVPTNMGHRYMLWTAAALQPVNSGLRFAYLLDVDHRGQVSGCRVIGNRFAANDPDQTCVDLAKRTRFSPAIDAQGNPVKAYYITRPKVQTYAY